MKPIINYRYLYYHLFRRYRSNTMSDSCNPIWPAITLSLALLSIPVVLVRIIPTIFENWLSLENWFLLIWSMVLFANVFYFLRKDRWKYIVAEFDKLPEDVNSRSGVVADVILGILIALFLLAGYVLGA